MSKGIHSAPAAASAPEQPGRVGVGEERGMADLHRVPVAAEAVPETAQGRDVGGRERAGQLDPEGVGARAERFDGVQKGAQRFVDVGEPAFVRDDLRKFEDEPEVGARLAAHEATVSRAGVA